MNKKDIKMNKDEIAEASLKALYPTSILPLLLLGGLGLILLTRFK